MQCSAAHNDDGVLITAQQISSAKNGKNGHHRHPATVQCTGGFCVFVILTFVGAWRADAAHFAQIFADLSRVFAVFRVRGERGERV